ncbi:MAG: mechanosensitive ion channel domain-containing protein [Phycisphaeraceae bacterium]
MTRLVSRWLPLFAGLVLLGVPAHGAEAPSDVDAGLASPRATMFTFLEAQGRVSRGQGDVEAALAQVRATLDWPADADDEAVRELGQALLDVLDRLGTVEARGLPDAPAVREEAVRRFTYFPTQQHAWVWERLGAGQAPEGRIVLEATEPAGPWRFSRETVAALGALRESMSALPPIHVADGEESELTGLLGPTFEQTTYWGWGALLVGIFLGVVAGKIASSLLRRASQRLQQRGWDARGLAFDDAAGPVSLAFVSLGLAIGLQFLHLEEEMQAFVHSIIAFLYLLALGWLIYNLVDIIDLGLRRAIEQRGQVAAMVVPMVRKTLRIFVVVMFSLVVAQNVFGLNITGWLAGLGIAGLAVSLAAQDSIKNLFGSLTVFFDKPFGVGDWILFDGQLGGVEEIGFRSTKIRLLNGHLYTVPNMKFIDSNVENMSARPSIRREMNVTITYDTPPEKIEQAVDIVREVLNDEEVVAEGRFDLTKAPPRVAFSELNSDSLNIKAFYWYQLARDPDRGYYSFLEHAQRVNLLLFRRFGEADIDFAFPTQTLHLAGDPNRELAVRMLQNAPADGDGEG